MDRPKAETVAPQQRKVRMKPTAPLVLALLLSACTTTASVPWGDPAGDVADPHLQDLCRDGWDHYLSWNPTHASLLGDPRHHGDLILPNPENRAAQRGEVEALYHRAAELDATELNASDRITLELLLADWRLELAELDDPADFDSWNLDPLEGPQGEFLTLAEDQPTATARERRQCLERWHQIPVYLDQVSLNLERSLRAGRTSSWSATQKVLGQLDEVLLTPPAESPLVAGVAADGPRSFRKDVTAVVTDEIYPALARLRTTISERVLPRARDDEHPGLAHTAGGAEAYALRIRRHTSLDLTAEEIHALGLAEVARIRAEIADLGENVFGTRDVAEIQRRLRNDPELHFSSREEVEAMAAACLDRANAVVPAAFGLLPAADCVIVRVPEHEERDTTIAYYREPAADGSRPGRYFINTFAPTTRPRYDAEVLAFHEAVPGHHLQIAIAQELDGLPLVRRHSGNTAYVEGWALYTERLCGELGLYTGDLDQFGVLSFDAWRACRLVVDTGLHAFGWSRQRAIDYMVTNTLLAENNVVNEVDRYIAWPGQALAYKLGQREILALRAEARAALGEDFDLSEFHDRVLENGAVTLDVLRRHVERWIADSTQPER
jgi:uncharacterized protein (DUF885 family)